MDQTDYYKILGIPPTAGTQEIKNAYRDLALKYHPDHNHNNQAATEQMKWVNEAYAVLSNATQRNAYDRLRNRHGSAAHNRFRQTYSKQYIFRGSDINRIFDEFTRKFGFRSFDDIFKDYYGSGFNRFEFKGVGFGFITGSIIKSLIEKVKALASRLAKPTPL